MVTLLDRLKVGSPAYVMSETEEGYLLIGAPDAKEQFSDLVRDLVNRGGDEFVVLPTSDGKTGYERVILLPL